MVVASGPVSDYLPIILRCRFAKLRSVVGMRMLHQLSTPLVTAVPLVAGDGACGWVGGGHWTVKYDFHLGVFRQNHITTMTAQEENARHTTRNDSCCSGSRNVRCGGNQSLDD